MVYYMTMIRPSHMFKHTQIDRQFGLQTMVALATLVCLLIGPIAQAQYNPGPDKSRYSQARASSNNSSAALKSHEDIMREVKQRYDAKVIKIKLSSDQRHYRVRILQANGKVQTVKITATP